MRLFKRGLVKSLDYEMILIFVKHPVHLKWYDFLKTSVFQTAEK